MGATVGLAVLCGVDFPDLTPYRWGMGQPLEPVAGYRVGQRLRSLAGDMWYLNTAFNRKPHPDVLPPGKALTKLVSDFVMHPSHIDDISLRDPRPGLIEAQEVLQLRVWPRIRGLVGR